MRYKGPKGKAWEAVKLYVRSKEKDCYTCGAKNLAAKNAQAGHYLPVALVGSNNTLSWDERQIHLQCGYCNGAGQGQQVLYRRRLATDYGEEMVQEFEKRRWKVDPIKDWGKVRLHYESMLKLIHEKVHT